MPKRARRKKAGWVLGPKEMKGWSFGYLAIFVVIFLVVNLFVLGVAVAISGMQILQNTSGQQSLIDSTIASSLSFPISVFIYLLMRGMSPRQIVKDLGLGRRMFNRRALYNGIKLFFAILLLEIVVSLITVATGVQLPTNVQALLEGMPIYFLLFSIFIAPINEEIFFRGFLVPRAGIVLSSLIFAAFHIGYGSVSEFAAAVAFGLLAGYVYKKNGSLYATIFAHMAVNALTISQFLP